jgi:ankyrin repeat protein
MIILYGIEIPEEIVVIILQFLNFEDILAFSRINKGANLSVTSNLEYICKQLFILIFPHAYNRLVEKKNVDYFFEYKKHYKSLSKHFNKPQRQLLIDACRNDLRGLSFLTESGQLNDFVIKNSDGFNVLQEAYFAKSQKFLNEAYKVIENLLIADKTRFRFRKPIYLAIACNQIDLVTNIIKDDPLVLQDSSFGLTPIHLAILFNNKKILQLLITYKPDLKIQDYHGNNALLLACSLNNLEFVQLIHQENPLLVEQKNSIQDSALHIAVKKNYPELVTFIISINPKLIDEKNIEGETPLILAASRKKININLMDMLIKNDANPLIKNYVERSVLAIAIIKKSGLKTIISLTQVIIEFVQKNPQETQKGIEIINLCRFECTSGKHPKKLEIMLVLENALTRIKYKNGSIDFLTQGNGFFSAAEFPWNFQKKRKRENENTEESCPIKYPNMSS